MTRNTFTTNSGLIEVRFIERWCSAKIVLDSPATLRGGRGGGGSKVNVTMTLIFPKVVWKCPLKGESERSELTPCIIIISYNIIGLSAPKYIILCPIYNIAHAH